MFSGSSDCCYFAYPFLPFIMAGGGGGAGDNDVTPT